MNDRDWSIEPCRGLGPLLLGMERRPLLQRLTELQIAMDADDSDPAYAELVDAEVMLTFDDAEPHRLRQIEVTDNRIRSGELSLIGRRLHEVLDAHGIASSDTVWRLDDTLVSSSTDDVDRDLAPPTDRQLLNRGVLWVISHGLGLRLEAGQIATVLLRLPEDLPRRGYGSITSEQRELSQQSNLAELLASPPLPGAWERRVVRGGLTVGLAAALGVLLWQAIVYQQRWNSAPVAEGVVVDVQPPPPAPFPDKFVVAYTDQQGQAHRVTLHPADVYVVREVGDKVEIRYLPDAPDQPLGPARVGDAAFLKFAPYAIGIVAVYLVLLMAATLLLMVFAPPTPAE